MKIVVVHDWKRRLQRGSRHVGETLSAIVALVYLVCVLLGPLAGLAYLLLTVVSGIWEVDTTQDWVIQLALFDAPWKEKLWTIVTFYGSFLWVFYILPPRTPDLERRWARGRRQRAVSGVWSHALLWTVVFGPLAYLCGWYTGLSWQLWGLVIAGVTFAFYQEVYKESRRAALYR